MSDHSHQSSDNHLREAIEQTDLAYEGSFLRFETLTARLPNNRLATRDVIRHPGAVAVLACTPDDRVVVVRQFRAALNRITLEIPAGKLDMNEDPRLTAARELSEETGITAGKMLHLTSIATAAGFCDEVIHLYKAQELTMGAAHPDEDEFVEIDMIPFDRLLTMVVKGEIQDSKTVIAVLYEQTMRTRRWQP